MRPLPGHDQALAAEQRASTPERKAELAEQRRKLCLIQAGSAEQRPLDFHSFRRAYNTALADAGVNVQTAMRLAEAPQRLYPHALRAARGAPRSPRGGAASNWGVAGG